MGKHLENCVIYAVDFDGTLCGQKFPEIGEPNRDLINWLIKQQKVGNKVILWTNRVGRFLENAVKWSAAQGLFYDAVNENIPEIVEKYTDILGDEKPSPKITADIFIDDSACGRGLPFKNNGCGINDCWYEEKCRQDSSYMLVTVRNYPKREIITERFDTKEAAQKAMKDALRKEIKKRIELLPNEVDRYIELLENGTEFTSMGLKEEEAHICQCDGTCYQWKIVSI